MRSLFNHIGTIVALVTMLGATVVSCGLVDSETTGDRLITSVTFDLRSGVLFGGQNAAGECRSIADEVVLTLPDSTYRESADPLHQPVTFETVTVKTGSVLFTADVLSNREPAVRLFSGSTTQEISGSTFADVGIDVKKLDGVPVMEACTLDDNLSIQIRNRGLGTLVWTIDSLSTKDCTDEVNREVACVSFMPQSGQIPAGAATPVTITVLAPPVIQTYHTKMNSPQGHIDFSITPQQGASLAVTLAPVK